ncbi:hypothetical protein QVD17_30575 [Tagetes erecta]|uniref:Uncharacterized protein n=1 Tax=Tagetes erecta TaxID=13708 RepID=A0AAD8K4J3_TARER|nr:hypothetical protein QVD17_30575 [Tagetes erecta]
MVLESIYDPEFLLVGVDYLESVRSLVSEARDKLAFSRDRPSVVALLAPFNRKLTYTPYLIGGFRERDPRVLTVEGSFEDFPLISRRQNVCVSCCKKMVSIFCI